LQAKHIPWRFCGPFDSILHTSTTFAKSKLAVKEKNELSPNGRLCPTTLPLIHTNGTLRP
jgi:hypothetical protein